MKKSPNWLEMPHDLMANIFQKLPTSEILKSARKVCRTWRTICNDPTLWKVIEIHRWYDGWKTDYHMGMMVKQVVDLSRGELIDISIKGFCTDDILVHILLSSSKLMYLFLSDCSGITGSRLSQAVKRVPQLEELRLYGILVDAIDIKFIGRNCPQLKSFMILISQRVEWDDLAIVNNMPELRHLEIYGDKMTNKGFQAILNGCPHLQSLHIYMFDGRNIDRNLVKLCTERIKDFQNNLKQ